MEQAQKQGSNQSGDKKNDLPKVDKDKLEASKVAKQKAIANNEIVTKHGKDCNS